MIYPLFIPCFVDFLVFILSIILFLLNPFFSLASFLLSLHLLFFSSFHLLFFFPLIFFTSLWLLFFSSLHLLFIDSINLFSSLHLLFFSSLYLIFSLYLLFFDSIRFLLPRLIGISILWGIPIILAIQPKWSSFWNIFQQCIGSGASYTEQCLLLYQYHINMFGSGRLDYLVKTTKLTRSLLTIYIYI